VPPVVVYGKGVAGQLQQLPETILALPQLPLGSPAG
jgi:hypothetical protein